MSEDKKSTFVGTGKYVPPHLRAKAAAFGAEARGGEESKPVVSSRFERPPPERRFADVRRFSERKPKTGSRLPNPALEQELFGDPGAELVSAGINFDKYDDIEVEVNGRDVPEAATTFAELELDPQLHKNVELCRFSKPTPIQKHAIPCGLAGRDLMACAQTGSGKTAAFLLPVISAVMKKGPNPTSAHGSSYRVKMFPSCLILAPTRELAVQIFDEAKKFTYCTGLRPVVVYGGAEYRAQAKEIEGGCDILVATPGRLIDFVERGKVSLEMVRHLIFDEADRMLDMGFEPQIRRIVEELGMPECAGRRDGLGGRQTLMFSATFPVMIQRLASDFLEDYVFLAVGRLGSTNDFIVQKVEYADEYEKKDRLMHLLLECEGLTIIFVETKRGADCLEDFLMQEGVNAISIHGGRTQAEREFALAQFRAGKYPVLVATDVAARGLDIPNVMHVINYDLPSTIDDYVHRIGRTGRRGFSGTAHSFFNEKNRNIAKDLYDLLKESKQEIPSWFEDMVTFSASRVGAGRGRGKPPGSRSKYGARDVRKSDTDSFKKPGSSGPRTGGGAWGSGGGRDAW